MTIIATDDMIKGDREPLLVQQPQPQPPPRYEPAPPPPPPPVWTTTQLPLYAPVQSERRSTGWRFLKAFCLAFFVLWLLSGVVSGFRWSWWMSDGSLHVLTPTFPTPGDGTVVECRREEALQYTYRGEPTKAFYLLSRGNTATGNVKVVEAPQQAADTIFVTVNVTFTDGNMYAQSKVCLLEDGSKRGVGIFAPNWRSPRPNLSGLKYNVVYHVPTSAMPTRFETFETDMLNFAHHFELSQGVAFFDRIALKSTNSPISAKAIEGRDVSLATSNGRISGEFVTGTEVKLQTSNSGISGRFVSDESVSLLTTNGPISSDVDLTSANQPVRLTLHTSNSRINGTALLHRNAADFSVTWFMVDLRTTNGLIDYAVRGAHERLNLVARTSNSHADVRLPGGYSGAIGLHSSNAPSPQVDFVGPREDPTGRGRTWHQRVNRASHNEWQGEVGWDVVPGQPRPVDWGSVEVTTSNGHAAIVVDNTSV